MFRAVQTCDRKYFLLDYTAIREEKQEKVGLFPKERTNFFRYCPMWVWGLKL